ncbi:hypothetical protein CANMA_005183 [Candida margitis]|uniref:uncharacterized protein n=1 Tax=Candida margitis TaxID=1775924 RepID=UPI002226600E|nr:uncharacterized protein CANMA_005183 [Candida margitis]KAI5950523.1 hypothetical protein CANMA_005183 [Candida margitis]
MDSSIDPEVSNYQIEDGTRFLDEEKVGEAEVVPSKANNTIETFSQERDDLAPTSSSNAEAALKLLNDMRQCDTQEGLNTSSPPPIDSIDRVQNSEEEMLGMKLVQYNPDGKQLRLGRPRKHILKPPSPLATSSSKNYNESVMSKFRLDMQPVEGPGSRGGKNLRKETRGKITSDAIKKRQQSVLNFSVIKSASPNKDSVPEQGRVEADESNNKGSVKLMVNVPKQTGTFSSLSEMKRLAPSKKPVINPNRNAIVKRNSKVLPSPLIPISYEEELMDHHDSSRLDDFYELALGYPIRKAPYATDIVYLIAFLSKFREILPVKNLGPKSFETGLSLPVPKEQFEGSEYTSKEEALREQEEQDDTHVSVEMEELFKKLLTLVLNRKKEVTSTTSAISELKPQSAKLGLPKEWKMFSPVESDVYEAGEPVDAAKPDILITEFPKEADFVTTFNPFYTSEFESKGLGGLENPLDRLLILKTLAQWSLSTSDIIKNYVSQNVQNQELPGEKHTYYASRALLYGFANCQQAKTRAESRLAKMKSTEEDLKYVDPSSDPTLHSMNLRLVDQVVGDLGFYVGRFYLCRMADGDNGGLSSVKKMNTVFKGQDVGLGAVLPSDFKLYVQNTNSILVGALETEGVEFDEDGNEVENSTNRIFDDSEAWYEVASNAAELKSFIEFLNTQLQDTERFRPSWDLQHSIVHLRDYLSNLYPLIKNQENLESTPRQKRMKTVDYSDKRAAAKYDDAFGEVVDETIGDNANDDDNYIDDDDMPDANDSEDDEEYID